MELAYHPTVTLACALLRVRSQRLLVEGAEHLPAHGPMVVAGNHVSETDPVAVGLALAGLGRRPRFLAKRELFDSPLLGPLLRSLRQVPVDRARSPAAALPRALLLLDAGETVVLFPEGTVSPSFVPAEPKHGAARLALASGAPLVPFATWGGQRVGHPDHPTRRGDRVALLVRFGPPVPQRQDDGVAAITRRLWAAVADLVEVVSRAYPQRPAGPEERWWLPAHLGGSAPTVEEAAEELRRKAAARAARASAARRAGGPRLR